MTDQRENFSTNNDGAIVIKYDDMLRFMNAKFSSTTCIQCGESKGWTVDTGNTSGYDPSKLTIYKMEYATGVIYRPFVVMSCNNCATIRQMSASTVDEWIRNNPEMNE
jgi:predicted nucleic-acid-binding Zn-ribbon protein